ncbi:MAG: hypothetical protein ABIQ24_02655, partial [Nitrospiraceae bacterium]
ENLRAHRTLIKIYQSQGLNESALQSCAVILAVNPRDEEALSAQSALGGPLKQKKEPDRPTPAAPVTRNLSAQQASMLPEAMPVSTPLEPKTATTDPRTMPTPSPHARAVAQLEAWLHTIESRRHDRNTTNEPHPKTS